MSEAPGIALVGSGFKSRHARNFSAALRHPARLFSRLEWSEQIARRVQGIVDRRRDPWLIVWEARDDLLTESLVSATLRALNEIRKHASFDSPFVLVTPIELCPKQAGPFKQGPLTTRARVCHWWISDLDIEHSKLIRFRIDPRRFVTYSNSSDRSSIEECADPISVIRGTLHTVRHESTSGAMRCWGHIHSLFDEIKRLHTELAEDVRCALGTSSLSIMQKHRVLMTVKSVICNGAVYNRDIMDILGQEYEE